MPQRRATNQKNGSRASKRMAILGCFAVIILAYFALVGHVLSSRTSVPRRNGNFPPPPPPPPSSSYQKPSLDDLVQGWNITGNVSWLMDFSIVGFPKTGTSSLMFYLEQYTDSIFTFPDERCELGWNQHIKLIRALYRQYQPHRRMGIKCPRDLENDLAMSNYNKFFPTTKLIVGLRHPILWFQSFYNFRVTNEFPMPPAERLIGKCVRANQGVCTYRANFSKHLKLIEPWRKVFVYHVDQLQETTGGDSSSGPLFRRDLGAFLSVSRPLDLPMIWVKPGERSVTFEKQKKIDALKMDICQGRYTNLRQVLLTQASQSADWIRNVFLSQPNVVVSNPDRFVKLLDAWHVDPCTVLNTSA